MSASLLVSALVSASQLALAWVSASLLVSELVSASELGLASKLGLASELALAWDSALMSGWASARLPSHPPVIRQFLEVLRRPLKSRENNCQGIQECSTDQEPLKHFWLGSN